MPFPTPPYGSPAGSPEWLAWFNRLEGYSTGGSNVRWDSDIIFTGSKLTDILSRPHSGLQSIAQANPTSNDSTRDAHVSDNDLKLAQDHRDNESNPHAVTASQLDLAIGVDVQKWDTDLDALAAIATIGLLFRTGDGTAVTKTIGVDVQAWDTDLDALAAITTIGLLFRTGDGTAVTKAIGVDVQAWDTDLDALATLATTGFISRTGSGSAETREIIASDTRLVVTDGDGIAGNPAIAVGVKSTATKSATYTITAADDIIYADTSNGAFTITLPVAVTGQQHTVKLIDGIKLLTIDGNGDETVDGSEGVEVSLLNSSLTFTGELGTGWYITMSHIPVSDEVPVKLDLLTEYIKQMVVQQKLTKQQLELLTEVEFNDDNIT